ncbi:DUF2635 domain-containing protein [Xanthobacter sp. 91]|uniref:DUF2635 domain-containing protein n=1 Tax=Xanthobacter TaxID=279 RepID=UPI0004957115|nr:DUF2635 domain-containing protein [Xanthobacter sp. 91]
MPRLRPTLVDIGEGPVPRLVRDPRDGKPLPAEGRMVPLNAFWQRRLRDRDVEIAPDPLPSEPETAAEAPSGDQPA